MGLLDDWAASGESRPEGRAFGVSGILPYARSLGANVRFAGNGMQPAAQDSPSSDVVRYARIAGGARPGRTAAGTPQLSARDRDYLDRYYAAVAALARQYDVDPALVLGMGGESGFGTAGTFRRTGDAFGMTGGSTRHMTYAASPEENARQFFDAYGDQIRGSKGDVDRFLNGIHGRDPNGKPIAGRKNYNSHGGYDTLVRPWIALMQRDVPLYVKDHPQ